MAYLQRLLITLVQHLPDPVIWCIGHFMHFCMASIIGLFGVLSFSGEIKHLFSYIIQHGLQSEPIAFFLVGVFSILGSTDDAI